MGARRRASSLWLSLSSWRPARAPAIPSPRVRQPLYRLSSSASRRKRSFPRSRLSLEVTNVTLQAEHTLYIEGLLDGGRTVQLQLPVTVEKGTLYAETGDLLIQQGEGRLTGKAWLVSSNQYGNTKGAESSLNLEIRRELTPSIDSIGEGIVFLNSQVVVNARNLMLGGKEGSTKAELSGCFIVGVTSRTQCEPGDKQVRVEVAVSAQSRSRGSFAFVVEIGGIDPGRFIGSVTLANYQTVGLPIKSAKADVVFDLLESRISGFDQPAVSIGQFLDVRGEGMIGGGSGQTVLQFKGNFRPTHGDAREVSFTAVSGFVDGTRVQLVIEKGIGVGEFINLSKENGTLEGTWTPILIYQSARREGRPASISLQIAPVKQVVWVRFLDSFREELKEYGLQAAEKQIRQRVLAAINRTYLGLNVELREELPRDFKFYAVLDIAGDDPNGLDLFGYDNTPGKDVNNERLFDHVGGVNALTQQDGYPGYGGVFLRSLFGLSKNPPAGVKSTSMASASFDAIFDWFRPDLGNTPVASGEVAAAPKLTSGRSCPASDRLERVACAIRVMGNLIGHTAAHELGHTFGLAEPYGASTVFHNLGNLPNRLMEAGSDRPFEERAEIMGQGPAVFCKDEFLYLQRILPTTLADPEPSRPTCD
jgi:hypothetical protein